MSAQSETDQSKFAQILTHTSVMSAKIVMKSYKSEAAIW